jgi:hypothetical protein
MTLSAAFTARLREMSGLVGRGKGQPLEAEVKGYSIFARFVQSKARAQICSKSAQLAEFIYYR